MKKTHNECVGCPTEMGCLGNSCPHRNVVRYYCDECGEEADLYEFDGGEYCIDCIEKKLDKVE